MWPGPTQHRMATKVRRLCDSDPDHETYFQLDIVEFAKAMPSGLEMAFASLTYAHYRRYMVTCLLCAPCTNYHLARALCTRSLTLALTSNIWSWSAIRKQLYMHFTFAHQLTLYFSGTAHARRGPGCIRSASPSDFNLCECADLTHCTHTDTHTQRHTHTHTHTHTHPSPSPPTPNPKHTHALAPQC